MSVTTSTRPPPPPRTTTHQNMYTSFCGPDESHKETHSSGECRSGWRLRDEPPDGFPKEEKQKSQGRKEKERCSAAVTNTPASSSSSPESSPVPRARPSLICMSHKMFLARIAESNLPKKDTGCTAAAVVTDAATAALDTPPRVKGWSSPPSTPSKRAAAGDNVVVQSMTASFVTPFRPCGSSAPSQQPLLKETHPRSSGCNGISSSPLNPLAKQPGSAVPAPTHVVAKSTSSPTVTTAATATATTTTTATVSPPRPRAWESSGHGVGDGVAFPLHYLSVDVESASGSDPDAWVMAVGLCLLDSTTGQVLLKQRFCMFPYPVRDRIYNQLSMLDDHVPDALKPFAPFMERRTYIDFWRKHMRVLLDFLPDMKPMWEQWTTIRNTIDGIYTTYPNVVLVSDCPDFDPPMMSRRFEWVRMHEHLCSNIRFDSQRLTGRHVLRDPSERLSMVPRWVCDKLLFQARSLATYDHSPENDAHYAAVLLMLLEQYSRRSFLDVSRSV